MTKRSQSISVLNSLQDEGDNIVEFTPDKTGTYTFNCGMGMFTGKIIVEA